MMVGYVTPKKIDGYNTLLCVHFILKGPDENVYLGYVFMAFFLKTEL